MVFGFGGPSLKGCSAVVTLSKTEFYPGEIIQGQLTLSVETAVECLRVTLGLVGIETLTWQESTSNDYTGPPTSGEVSSIHNSESTTYDCDVKKDVIRKELSLLQPVQNVLARGQHAYPFTFELPANLPGSYETIPTDGNYWAKICSRVSYGIEIKIQQVRAKEPKLVNARPITVLPPRLQPAAYVGRAVGDSDEACIRQVCCVSKGTCKLTVFAERDTVGIQSGVLPLVATVANNTSLAINSFKVSLYQALLVHIPNGAHRANFTATPKLVHAKTVTETLDPHTTREGIRLPISMLQYSLGFRHRIAKSDMAKFQKAAPAPSCKMGFVSVLYHVTVEVNFNARFVTTLDAGFTIRLLNIPEPGTVASEPNGVGSAAVVPTQWAVRVDAAEATAAPEPPHVDISLTEIVSSDQDGAPASAAANPAPVESSELHITVADAVSEAKGVSSWD